ncbi:MAG: WG repeat-containing protein [Muribaculaceae bacterium]|nr:WG repeat-containing protein [Muribaculaceae bacterium]
MKHSFLISLVVLCMSLMGTRAAAQNAGWDEVGPTITSQKMGISDLAPKNEQITAVKKGNKWGFVTPDNKAKIKPKYDAIGETVTFAINGTWSDKPLSQQAILVQEKGKWGLVGANGKVLIKPEYDSLGNFYTTTYRDYNKYVTECRGIAKVGNTQYIINTKGKKIKSIYATIKEMVPYGGNILGLCQDGSLIVIDGPDLSIWTLAPGLYAIDNTIYSSALNDFFVKDKKIRDNITVATNNAGKSLILRDGKLFSDNIYSEVKRFDNNRYYLTKEDGTSDLINYDKLIPTNKTIRDAKNGDVHLIYSNPGSETIGVMKPDGTIVTEPIYTKYAELEDPNYYKAIALYIGDEPRLIINNNYQTLELPEGCEKISYHYNVEYEVTGKAGMAKINVQNCTFTMPFSDNKYSVYAAKDRYITSKDGNKWGIVDPENNNKVIVPFIYDNIKEIKSGIGDGKMTVKVTKNGQYGVIDINGKTIIPLGRYKQIPDYQYSHYIVKNGNKYGLVNNSGKLVVPVSYDQPVAISASNGNIMVGNNTANGATFFVYNSNGKLLKQQSFTNSDLNSYRLKKFFIDWLGNSRWAFQL